MPNTPITMSKLRTIIRLHRDQQGLKTISKLCGISRNTVKKYIRIWNTIELSYENFLSKSDSELHELFCVTEHSAPPDPRREELERRLPAIAKEMNKKGMTIQKQWEKYIGEVPDGYTLTPFRLTVRRYQKVNNPILHIEHKAGDKMYIDYTGSKLWIYPPGATPYQVEVFVAILGCSLLTYVEAVNSQCKEDLITACENAFYYYGGVPLAVVPDNLKSAVTKGSRYEAVLNGEFERFGEHYGVTVVPARVRKPKDKAHVENAVKLTYKDIFTHIEPLHCPDLISLNAAIRSALELHNSRLLTRRNYSRRSYFEDIEREALGELNPIRYQIKRHVMATVGKDGHVRLGEDVHNYSVPYTHIGKKIKISYTASHVEIFEGYTLIAEHQRDRTAYRYTTNPEHLCPQHKAIMEWAPEKFIAQAAAIHEDVEHYIRKVLERKRYRDQAYKCCSGILNFARRVGGDRLAAACRLADSYGRYSFLEIQDILHNQSEGLEVQEEVSDMPEHENIRGKEYYK